MFHVETLACLRCGNEWTPRKANPKRCPGCQNPNWNRPRTKRRKTVTGLELCGVVRQVAESAGVQVIEDEMVPGGTVSLSQELAIPIPSISEARRRAEELFKRLQ
jgi:DNA-directed RNA polymerase subunit RPC12/RpoP